MTQNARLLKVFPKGFGTGLDTHPPSRGCNSSSRTADLDKVYAAANAVVG